MAIWAVSALAIAAAVIWAVIDSVGKPVATVPAEALPSLFPTESELAALVPRSWRAGERTPLRPLCQGAVDASFQFYTRSRGPGARLLIVYIAVFQSPDAAVRGRALLQGPVAPVALRAVPMAVGPLFVRGNVVAVVKSRPRDETLTRRVVRLVGAKIAEAAKRH